MWRKHISKLKRKNILAVVFIGVFAILGVWIVRFSFASTTTTCGKVIQNYTYQVPFGNAVWNQPVCDLQKSSRYADYAKRFYDWSTPDPAVQNGFLGVSPGFPEEPTLDNPDGLGKLFTREVYFASDATTQKKVSSLGNDSNLDGTKWNSNPLLPRPGYKSQHPDTPIPWNPEWKTGKGGDNEMYILDDRPGPTQGRIYTISIYQMGLCAADALLFPDRVCGSSIQVSRDHYGNHIDYRTYEGYVGNRGVGLSYYATLTTPQEVAANEIRHALGVAIPNTAYGSVCSEVQQGSSAEGTTCGTAVAPASKFEWANQPHIPVMKEQYKSLYNISRTIPEGMRFALDMSYGEIDNWILSRSDLKNNKRRADTARIFARALKDYGMIIVDTNGERAGVQVVGGVNPNHAKMWQDLGLGPEYKDDLLNGLITRDNLYVVEPPTLECANGKTSKYFCDWLSASYGQQTASPYGLELEAESGVPASGAQIIQNDSSASGGASVQF